MSSEFYPLNVYNDVQDVLDTMGGDLDHFEDMLGTELWSILKQVNVVSPGQYDDPGIIELFKWLVDPRRTVQEINCLLGPVGLSGWIDGLEHLLLNLNGCVSCCIGLVASEALAFKCPILVGEWERSIWYLWKVITDMAHGECPIKYIKPSEQLGDWIIRMMKDTKFCPNPYLRLVFLDLYRYIVYDVIPHNNSEAFESIIFICSTMNNIDFTQDFEGICYFDPIVEITWLLNMSFGDGNLKAFDRKLSDQLLVQISDIIQDVSFSKQLKPYRNMGTYEMGAVIELFRYTSEYAKHLLKNCIGSNYYEEPWKVPTSLNILLIGFELSCQTPQIIETTAECLMSVLELVFYINIDLITKMKDVMHHSLQTTDKLLKNLVKSPLGSELLTGLSIASSPIVQTLKLRNRKRLDDLRKAIGKLGFIQIQTLNLDQYIFLTCTVFS